MPQLFAVLAGLPLSASLQRDDFRRRLADGAGLSLGELLYSVVMALDSVHVRADVEISATFTAPGIRSETSLDNIGVIQRR